ncbi:MAG: DUF3035 domain-containing protein [Rhodospirillaceae bacterium]
MNGNGRSKTERTAPLDRRLRARRRAASLSCLAAGALLLSGCGGWRQTFGLDHAPPDEFTVVAQPPLSMPPDFNLRPPRPGAARPQDVGTTQAAAATVFGFKEAPGAERVKGAASSAESVFLARAGAGNAQPNIRAALDAETRNLIAADKHWVDRLIFWQKQQQPYSAVDAAAEAKRLRDNAALGQPVTAGNTPTIERKRKAPLEGIF